MKHYLARTLLYGVGAGIFLFLLINNLNGGSFILFLVPSLLLIIAFLATEILPRANSATPEAKTKRQDKITLFTPLALSGVGLALAVMLSTADWQAGPSSEGISSGSVLVIFCGCPFGLIYTLSLLRVLARLTRRRNDDSLSETSSSNTTISNYGLRLLIMSGVVLLGCITLLSAYLLIDAIRAGDLWSNIASFIIMVIITGIGSFGVFKLVQLLRK